MHPAPVMLQLLDKDIWTAAGPQVRVLGFGYPTALVVIRLKDGDLFIWSPTQLSPELKAAVDALGPVRHLVSPTAMHNLFLGEWQAAYPDARLCAPPGLRQRRPDLAFDGDLADGGGHPWSEEIDQVQFAGNRIATEVVFFHRASRTALFADLIQQLDPASPKGWRALIARLDLMTGPAPQTPRKFRLAFTDRKAARAALARITAWPARRVLMAHAPPVLEDGQAFIARTFAWLRG
ncbi:DUF4336 domain-containing protein [Phenylobacterium sp.]|uniref:DUF4336 domain-containing protein n=1 Tax=Phenylobacterium sp. TaxID=1871053 RepID=UPI00273201BD|nr:DUF4336 domain-containing protein [Phenylobacterium sp.]MDP1619355.1 DUF4336 domain-containing protein [Phenylobacterium sp.]MDP1987478.1 DUF4336 domain-containing protein [Phenylobacterium sp.]